jgi:hypothetical protein
MTDFRRQVIGDALVIGAAVLTSGALMVAFGVSVIGRAAPGVSLTLLASVADVPAALLVVWARFRRGSGTPLDAGAEDHLIASQEVTPAQIPEGRGNEVTPW